MLDGRFSPPRLSHEHTLHLCKATLKMFRPGLEAPDIIGQTRFSEILIRVVFNCLESFMKWFADCSHCNQERPLPTKKTCLVSIDMESLATNSSCRSNVLLVLSIVASIALSSAFDCCQLLLLAIVDQLDQYRQVSVLPSQTFHRL